MTEAEKREREGAETLSPGTQQQRENTLAQQEYKHGSSLLVPTPRGFSTLFFHLHRSFQGLRIRVLSNTDPDPAFIIFILIP